MSFWNIMFPHHVKPRYQGRIVQEKGRSKRYLWQIVDTQEDDKIVAVSPIKGWKDNVEAENDLQTLVYNMGGEIQDPEVYGE